MSLSYKRLARSPKTFLRATGITIVMFEEIMTKLRPLWNKEIKGAYKRPGRNFKLPLEDILLMFLLYYRTYTSMVWIGFLFNLNASNVSRLSKSLEPLLAQITTVNKERILSEDDVRQCVQQCERIVDATEQKIQRPSNEDQRPFYSGKKKQHTMKTEIQTTTEGKIVRVSKSVPGATHDMALRQAQPALHQNECVYVDSGYQGLQKVHAATELPFKATKTKPLDEESKRYNAALSRIRIKIEHVFGDIKVFRIMKDVYRNSRCTYTQKFAIVAGLVNLKNGFGL